MLECARQQRRVSIALRPLTFAEMGIPVCGFGTVRGAHLENQGVTPDIEVDFAPQHHRYAARITALPLASCPRPL